MAPKKVLSKKEEMAGRIVAIVGCLMLIVFGFWAIRQPEAGMQTLGYYLLGLQAMLIVLIVVVTIVRRNKAKP